MSEPEAKLPDISQDIIDYGDSPFIPGLFNTILSDALSEELLQGIAGQRRHIDAGNLRYAVLPDKLPVNFDPRTPIGFPEDQIKFWFYKTYKGAWSAISSLPLDQAGCGSCWAFSTSTQFSDVIRFNLLKRYPDACLWSPFFLPAWVCTGEADIVPKAQGAVVNPGDVKIYPQEIRNQISAYFTVAFSPKISTVGRGGLDTRCNDALNEWKSSIATKGRVPKLLSQDYNSCLGCQGNLIVCPLMLYTGAEDEAPGNAKGAPLLTDFPLHEWVCLWGNQTLRQSFCSPQFISGEATSTFPKLYKADAYSYVTAKDFDKGKRVRGINNMADWMRCSIYNYGTITIGFSVFPSLLSFFGDKKNANRVYTAEQFIADFRRGKNSSPLGGHAVVVIGWKEEMQTDTGGKPQLVKYWIVRNSWGTKWGENGFFKIERDIDLKLARAQLPPTVRVRFESEFGSLYFAPNPNPELFDDSGGEAKINEMKEYLIPVPRTQCPSLEDRPDLLELMTKNCKCRCGYAYNPDSKNPGGCDPVTEVPDRGPSTPTPTTLPSGIVKRSMAGCGACSGSDFVAAGRKRFTVLDQTVYTRPEPIPVRNRPTYTAYTSDSDSVLKIPWYQKSLPLLLLLLLLGFAIAAMMYRHRKTTMTKPITQPLTAKDDRLSACLLDRGKGGGGKETLK
jgi:hypothetical protein